MGELRLLPDEVVRTAALGDREARRALVEGYGPALYALCRRLDPDPEDCYQEIWEKVFKALPRFDPDGPARFSTWLYSVAHRHLIDRHRRRQVRGEVMPLEDVEAPEGDASAEALASERRQLLLRALQRLPAGQRRVVLLHHGHGLPLEAIAEREGVATGTVKSRLHRGRARLAQILGGVK